MKTKKIINLFYLLLQTIVESSLRSFSGSSSKLLPGAVVIIIAFQGSSTAAAENVSLSRTKTTQAKESSPATNKKKSSKAAQPPKLIVKGKVFKIKTLSSVTVKVDESVPRPAPYTSIEKARIKLPVLQASTSVPSPLIPASELNTSVPPLVRYTLKATWIGSADKRLASEWSVPTLTPLDVAPIAMDSYTDGEFKVLESLVLLKSNDTTPIAAGLAQPLLKSDETRAAAHEILGIGLGNLKVRTASQEHFKNVLNTEKETPRAKRSLIYALSSLKPNDYSDAQYFSPFVQKLKLEDKDIKALPLAQARDFIQRKELESAWNVLSRIPENSESFYEGQYLKATVMYRSNNIEEAKTTLENLLQKLQSLQSNINKDLKSLTASTLAQIYFQQGNYKSAFNTYRLIDQEHPLWLESLVETAWSQILLKDYEGAAGNMFSLHTNYFKGAYKPESYIVRTVGYLQLCQFGDALSVLKDFLRKYKYAQTQIQAYKKKNPNHFEVVRDFLKAGTPKNFAGLPRSLIIEIARDSKFIELQRKLNEIEDDINKMEQLSAKVDEVDQKFMLDQKKYTQLLKDLETHIAQSNNPTKKEALLSEKSNFERHLRKLSLLRRILQDSKQGLAAEVASFNPYWNKTKNSLKEHQNKALQASFQNLEADLNHWIDQSELLYYEVHNGAGEHLRYQMATNSTGAGSGKDSRAPASDKVKAIQKEDKDQQWAFDGEIWEDEVGHYRSSLKNVCPEDNTTQMGQGRKPAPSPDSAVAHSEDAN